MRCLLTLALTVVISGGCAPLPRAGREGETHFVVEDREGVRQRLVLNGVRLVGEITVTDRGDSTFVNGELWLPPPGSAAPDRDDPFFWWSASEEDSLRMRQIPYIARRAPPSGPIAPVVVEYFRKREETSWRALNVYRSSLRESRDSVIAESLACLEFDPEIVDTAASLGHTPRFSPHSLHFYSPGLGWEVFMSPPKPSHDEVGTRPGGEPRGPALKSLFSSVKSSVIVVLLDGGTYSIHGGRNADLAAEQIDALADPDTVSGNASLARLADPADGLPPEILRRLRVIRASRKIEL